ncbi:MAG: hypothetical protein JHC66_06885 [Acidimicrobiia bacterium]|nr:hypothetical protein [Acidimicrobiia bacterium]MBJ7382300.1 hypothetical protein [Acidimicrobiia bacterium]
MTELVVVVLIATLIVSMIVIVALEPGPSPSDLAIAYELAWDRLDFATIWALSGPSMRDGLTKREFVVKKKTVYAQGLHPTNLVSEAKVDEVAVSGEVAVAITSLTLLQAADDSRSSIGQIHNEVRMARRMGRWEVASYLLHAPQA